MNNALTIEKLSVSYDNKEALKDISLKIPEHRITAVIGPSGCGKSTFLKCLNGQIMEENARVSGKVTLSGTDISKLKPSDLRRKVGLVFQTPAPFPMSIYKNMTYAPRYYGMNDREDLKRTVTEKLKLTGLYDEVKDELKKSAVKLSGGQKQRLCIARALTVDPEVLLLDEPCSALDIKSTSVIEELLLRLKETYTIVIVTHNLGQAARISDMTAFINDGRLVEFGETGSIFKAPEMEETKDFITGSFG